MRILLTLVCFVSLFGKAEKNDSLSLLLNAPYPHKARIISVASAEAVIAGGSIIGLNELWYKNYPRTTFHFFNDNKEWLMMDKLGHLTTSYKIGVVGAGLFRWSGMSKKKAAWYGGTIGGVYLFGIELLDGYSDEWGFSWGDMAANILGTATYIAQDLAWGKQRFGYKYTFHATDFAMVRPELLGKNRAEQYLKDYNGQTYWLSVNVGSFLKQETRFPKWLNVALGYGAEGMIGGRENPITDANGNPYPYFDRQRQYYLSLDIDLKEFRFKRKWMKSVASIVSFLKIPAPTLELTNGKMKFYPIYY